MTVDQKRLLPLVDMAGLVLDARSQSLRKANDDRDALVRQLQALEARPAEDGPIWPAPELARFGYDQWAAKRRAELNLKIAAQTVVCMQAAADTRLAFGRKIALDRIVGSLPKRQLS